MNQQYIVIAIIVIAIAYTIYSTGKALFSKSNESACGGCGNCEFKQQAKKNLARKQKEQLKSASSQSIKERAVNFKLAKPSGL